MRAVLAAIAVSVVLAFGGAKVAKAEIGEPDSSRFGAPHFLDDLPLSKSKRARVKQTHERVYEAAIAKPSRYIAGRLICARNVNAALAERGIKGPGGASSKAFLAWGKRSPPIPGAVAYNNRKGGGHVSLVSHVDSAGRVWVWNPSPRGQGWQLRVNPYRSIYLVPA